MPKTVAIYARVSTDRQTTDSQLHQLRDFVRRAKWKVYREYIDTGYSGKNTQRPAYTEMLSDARRRRFELLLVWKLDRLSRSLKDLITTLDELGHLGIDFVFQFNPVYFVRVNINADDVVSLLCKTHATDQADIACAYY